LEEIKERRYKRNCIFFNPEREQFQTQGDYGVKMAVAIFSELGKLKINANQQSLNRKNEAYMVETKNFDVR